MPNLATQTLLTSKAIRDLEDGASIQSDKEASRKHRLQHLLGHLTTSLNDVTKENQLNIQAHLRETDRVNQLKERVKSLEAQNAALLTELNQFRTKNQPTPFLPERTPTTVNKPFLGRRQVYHGCNPHGSFQPAAQPTAETTANTAVPSTYRPRSK